MFNLSTTKEKLPYWMTVNEVAQYWRVHRGTIYKMIKDGTLKARNFGRLIRVHRDTLFEENEENQID